MYNKKISTFRGICSCCSSSVSVFLLFALLPLASLFSMLPCVSFLMLHLPTSLSNAICIILLIVSVINFNSFDRYNSMFLFLNSAFKKYLKCRFNRQIIILGLFIARNMAFRPIWWWQMVLFQLIKIKVLFSLTFFIADKCSYQYNSFTRRIYHLTQRPLM